MYVYYHYRYEKIGKMSALSILLSGQLLIIEIIWILTNWAYIFLA